MSARGSPLFVESKTNKQTKKHPKLTGTENRQVVARGGGGREWEKSSCCF